MKYFNPNWHSINKSIAAGELAELRKEEKHIKETIQNKINLYFKNKVLAERLAKIKALKDLPIEGEIFYIGRFPQIAFGAQAFKKKDGRVYMEVSINNKHWLISYAHLKNEYPTPEEFRSHEVTTRINNLFSNK